MANDEPLRRVRDPKKIITINTVNGTKDKHKLKDCYFYPTDVDGAYLLCSEHNETLTVVASGQPFMFEHDGLIWKVPNPLPGSEPFTIVPGFASGSWQNNDVSITADDSGTFIAQGSGSAGGDDENASYAAAK